MNITKIKLNSETICGNSEGSALLLSVADGYEYVDGKATNNIINQKYTVVLTDNEFEKITVKVDEKQPVITNEEIQSYGGHVKAVFTGLAGKFYRSNSGEYLLSAKADSVKVVG